MILSQGSIEQPEGPTKHCASFGAIIECVGSAYEVGTVGSEPRAVWEYASRRNARCQNAGLSMYYDPENIYIYFFSEKVRPVPRSIMIPYSIFLT